MNIHSTGAAVRRREAILDLIRSRSLHSQDELLSLLLERGIRVTQPTLSRDLRELGVAKSPAGYVAPGTIEANLNVAAFTPRESRQEKLNRLVRDAVLSADVSMNLVVLKTPFDAAKPLASALDAAELDEVLGTVGGDDTIFIALSSIEAAASLAQSFQQIAGIGPSRRRSRS